MVGFTKESIYLNDRTISNDLMSYKQEAGEEAGAPLESSAHLAAASFNHLTSASIIQR
jgi:hypothetical protein